jgi:hypothetical protein
MSNNPIFAQAREWITEGHTHKALELLAPLEDRVIQIATANFNAIRQNDNKNTLSFDEAQRAYSKINDALLQRLADLEQDHTIPHRTKHRYWIFAILILLATALGWWAFSNRNNEKCPNFEENAGFKIVVIPFFNLKGKGTQRPDVGIMNRINDLTKRKNLLVQTGMYGLTEQKILDAHQFDEMGNLCNADLIIHGDFNTIGEDSLQVILRYKFLKTNQTGNPTIDALPSIGAMDKMRSIDDVVFSICAQIAARQGKPDIAKAWLDKLKEKDEKSEIVLQKALE